MRSFATKQKSKAMKSKRQQAYEKNKVAKVGENITCPVCKNVFKKVQWQQAFCCGKCKDDFWNNKSDRHKKGYYHKYNKEHPERLERGYTKGYVNGCVSEGATAQIPNYNFDGGCAVYLGNGYYIDRMGWKRHVNSLTDALLRKEQEWHDDDWCESTIDD